MPWSNGGQRRGGGPPHDLEDLLRRGQDKIKQAMPGGSGLPGSFVFLAVVVIMAVAPIGAACEWEYTATLAVGLAKPRQGVSLDQSALLEKTELCHRAK